MDYVIEAQFQSTRPVWGATLRHPAGNPAQRYFNPRAPCGARPLRSGFCRRMHNFNPRAPCGARHQSGQCAEAWGQFQSTRPVWGATQMPDDYTWLCKISIHAPRVGRDHALDGDATMLLIFQSTRPVWGATPEILPRVLCRHISIHAPRVGRDRPTDCGIPCNDHFNPRAPCGARLQAVSRFHPAFSISIHAPRVGRDSSGQRDNSLSDNFNPRAPCGARPPAPCCVLLRRLFQSTRPVWGATQGRER